MLALSMHADFDQLEDRLRDAHAVTAELMSEATGETYRRFPSLGQTEKTADRTIDSVGSLDGCSVCADRSGTAAMAGPPHRLRWGRMALRAVPRARASRMARSIDRNPSREFAARHLDRLRRRTTHHNTVEQSQRSDPAVRRKRALRAGP